MDLATKVTKIIRIFDYAIFVTFVAKSSWIFSDAGPRDCRRFARGTLFRRQTLRLGASLKLENADTPVRGFMLASGLATGFNE